MMNAGKNIRKGGTALALIAVLFGEANLFADTHVVAWGANNYGQTSVPAGLTNVIALAGGSEHSVALKADGTVAAWGWNYYGELNFAGDLTNAVAISAGGESSYALRADGTCNACGYFTGNQTYPPGYSIGNDLIAVAAGKFASVGLNADGSMFSWGDTAYYIGNVPPGMTNIIGIATGWTNAAVLRSDGTVAEWTVDSEFSPAEQVPGISNIVAISAGYYHRVGLRNDGTVAAWGDNTYGQTNAPAGLSNVVAISCGGYHTLALKSDGTVVAWGDGSSYAPWDPNSAGQSIVPAGLTNVVAIAGGGLHSLALVATNPLPPFITTPPFNQTVMGNSTTWLWAGAAGFGPFTYQWSLNGMPLPLQTNNYLKLLNVQLSDAGVYSITVSNAFGGTNASMTLNVTPWINVQPASQSVLAGATVTFTSTSGGLTPGNYQWLFNGTNLMNATNSSLVLTNVQLNQAGVYSLNLTNSYGGLTSTGVTLSVGAINISSQPQSKATWIGNTTAFSVTPNGSGPFNYQWRFNTTNLLGTNGPSLILTNLQMPQFGAYDVVVANAYGSLTSSVANLSYSQVALWGSSSNLPSGLTNVIAIAGGPVVLQNGGKAGFFYGSGPLYSVYGLSNAAAISGTLNFEHLALFTNGTTVAWNSDGVIKLTGSGSSNAIAITGDNYGDLELKTNGTLSGSALSGAPLPVTAATNIVAISEGYQHSIALTSTGTVLAWGNNSYGQGVVPNGISNIVAIAAGGYHNLALKNNGTVFAWGGNYDHQTNVPPGLSNVVAIAAGLNHSVALKNDNTVVCWGLNTSGQTNTPAGLSNVMAIAADNYNTIALIGNGQPVQVVLTNLTWSTNSISFPVPTDYGRVYALEYKNLLTDSNWTALPLVAGNEGVLTLSDRLSVTNSHRFYRVRRW